MPALTPQTVIAYLTRFPTFANDVVRICEYGQELSRNPLNLELPQRIAARAMGLGVMIALRNALDSSHEA